MIRPFPACSAVRLSRVAEARRGLLLQFDERTAANLFRVINREHIPAPEEDEDT